MFYISLEMSMIPLNGSVFHVDLPYGGAHDISTDRPTLHFGAS
jgi:hypothetical protein